MTPLQREIAAAASLLARLKLQELREHEAASDDSLDRATKLVEDRIEELLKPDHSTPFADDRYGDE